jgi:hypothetical protein
VDIILGYNEEDEDDDLITYEHTEHPVKGPDEGGPMSRAKDLLSSKLASGPIAMKEMEAEFKQAGISWRTAQRARALLKIPSMKMKGSWYWCLPEENSEGSDVSTH